MEGYGNWVCAAHAAAAGWCVAQRSLCDIKPVFFWPCEDAPVPAPALFWRGPPACPDLGRHVQQRCQKPHGLAAARIDDYSAPQKWCHLICEFLTEPQSQKELSMKGKKHTPEQIIGKLREADAELNGGATIALALGVQPSPAAQFSALPDPGGICRHVRSALRLAALASATAAERTWRDGDSVITLS